MKKIILDCDNTFGIKNCNVDSGLALTYLLGSKEAGFLGVTSAYGSNSPDVVQAVNLRMLEELGRRGIPVRGGRRKRGCYQSEAVSFLAKMMDRHPRGLSTLATGSLTSLRGAYERDKRFFERVKEVILMNGIISPLVFDKKVVGELNFPCDPPAARTVLTKGRNVSIMAGDNCFKVLFTKQEYRERFSGRENRTAAYIMEETDYWSEYNDEDYGTPRFYNWDVMVVAYLMHPELFEDDVKCLRVPEQDLGTRHLGVDSDGMRDRAAAGKKGERCTCNLPVVREPEALKDNIYETWLNAPGIRTGVCKQN